MLWITGPPVTSFLILCLLFTHESGKDGLSCREETLEMKHLL